MINGVVGFGESVIDFIPMGMDDGCTVYKACPGGSVANMCVVLARQGIPAAFVGGVGRDHFGQFLKERISQYGVHTEKMIFTPGCGTNLTFVHLKEDGQREYSSVNRPGADKMVSYDQIDVEEILKYRVLHVSSNAMACGKTREAQPRLLEEAKKRGMLISYDVNYRPGFYETKEDALRVLQTPLAWADIVKVTEEELEVLTGGSGRRSAEKLLENGAGIVLVTKGNEGCDYYFRGGFGHADSFQTEAVDTTGAGDCFLGGFLSWMLRNGSLKQPDKRQMEEACVYANKTAALSIRKTGAMSSVPTREEVEQYKF
ncbi:MAG: carbohydrate kinase [Eubacteriales bacterium]|nr:carbohydrate kinase [Eubacteriales bacterium]